MFIHCVLARFASGPEVLAPEAGLAHSALASVDCGACACREDAEARSQKTFS